MLISVISPCFTAEKYLENTFACLVAQTYQDWEWVIVDDCSTDNSWNVLNKFVAKDSRVRAYRLEKNSGPSVCRNKGLELARGEYIAFLDADDQWLPKKLAEQLNFMITNQIEMSCHNYKIMSESELDLKSVNLPRSVNIETISVYNPLATSFMMIKRDAICDLRFDETLRRRQDWVFWYRLIKKVKVCHNLDMYLGRYRKDSLHSISKNKFHMALLQWKMYRKYFGLSFLDSSQKFICYAYFGVRKHLQVKTLAPVWITTPILIVGLIAFAVAAVD